MVRTSETAPQAMADDGTEARKRRIVERSAVGRAAALVSRMALAHAGVLQRASGKRPLVSQGQPSTAIAFIDAGSVRLTRTLPDGRAMLLGYRSAGELVGEASLGSAVSYEETAVACDHVEALMMPVTTVRTIIEIDPRFGSAFFSIFTRHCHEAEERVASLVFRSVEARLAEFLANAAARWGVPTPGGVLIAALLTHALFGRGVGAARTEGTRSRSASSAAGAAQAAAAAALAAGPALGGTRSPGGESRRAKRKYCAGSSKIQPGVFTPGVSTPTRAHEEADLSHDGASARPDRNSGSLAGRMTPLRHGRTAAQPSRLDDSGIRQAIVVQIGFDGAWLA
jgi:CRP/FNR family cyclic AMP-dependent transcriptional regulator